MDRLGLSHEALAADCPRPIYCSLKGFLPGPYEHRDRAGRGGADDVGAGLHDRAAWPAVARRRVGDRHHDRHDGRVGILAALQDASRRGGAGWCAVACSRPPACLMGHHMATAAVTGEPLQPMPARVSAWAIYNQFETADGQRVFVGVTSDQQWARFCQVFQRPDWLADQRLATNNDRIDANGWLLPAVREMLARCHWQT